MKPKKRTIPLALSLFLAVLIGLPVWSVCRQVRQERLNRDLIVAIFRYDPQAVVQLLAEGADANARGVLQQSQTFRQLFSNAVRRLRHQNIDDDNRDFSALQIAIERYPGPCTLSEERDQIIPTLLSHGADAKASPDGIPLLYVAADEHLPHTVRLLLEHGADPNTLTSYGEAPLQVADADSAILLLNYGADVNATDPGGFSPLIEACRRNDLDLARVLVLHGANVNARDIKGSTVLYWALHPWKHFGNTPAILRLLKQHNAKQ